MNFRKPIVILRATAVAMVLLCTINTRAQNDIPKPLDDDSIEVTTGDAVADDIIFLDLVEKADSAALAADSIAFAKSVKRAKRDWDTWRPDPKRALWLAIMIPGAGQVYNRKYWKLPIVYGGFMGCIYAMQWNNQMYRDYSQAYLDLMDTDPNTQSYNQFLHLGSKITSQNESRYKTLFKKRKDYYRRYRDLSFFVLLGVYAISVVDAYIDASLSDFDISKDLSMKVAPAVIDGSTSTGSHTPRNPVRSSAIGLHCSLTF